MKNLLFFAFTLCPTLVMAGPKDRPVIVEASSYRAQSSQYSSSVDIYTEEDLKRTQDLDLQSFLKRQSAYHFSTQGAPGASSSLYLRGSDSSHVSVLIDGVVMNDPSNPNRAFDFGHLPLSQIERVEILKGPQSILYGSDALGGVISITTKKNQGDDTSTRLRIYRERYNTQALSLSQDSKVGKLKNSFSIEFQESDGFSSASKSSSGPLTDDGRKLLAFNNQLRFENFQFSLGFSNDQFDLDKFDEQTGLPLDAKYDEGKDQLFYSSLIWKEKITSKLSSDYTLSFKNQKRMTRQNDTENRFWGRTLNTRLNHRYALKDHLTLSFGLHLLLEESIKPLNKSNTNWGPYSKLFWDFEKYYFNFGLRSETHQQSGHRLDYSFGGGLYVGESTQLKYHFTTGFKSPTLSQLYDPSLGNKNLKAEESLHHEASVLWSPKQTLETTLALFSTRLKNRLSFDPASFRSLNRGEAFIHGGEVQLRLKNLFLKSDLSVEATILKAYSKTSGADLLRRPRQKYTMSLTSYWTPQVETYFSVQRVSKRFDLEKRVLNAYTNLFLSAHYKFNPTFRLLWKIDNILDEETSDAFGYQSAGRTWGLGIQANF